MKINADLSARAVMDTAQMEWVPSPAAGVERKMLDRDGEESGRATTIVRFARGSSFPEHTHVGGEEFLVLEGMFCDEMGDFGPGTYVRNPIGTSHSPATPDGCVILVKLCQMTDPDEATVVVDTRNGDWTGVDDGVETLPLFQSATSTEEVRMERWAEGTASRRVYDGGAEYFILEGALADDDGTYSAGTWLRLPPGASHSLRCSENALVWTKRGHLASGK